MSVEILIGDALAQLRTLPDESVHACITSPPYYNLRDYGTATWEGGDPGCDHEGSIQHTAPPGTAKQASNAGSNAVRSGSCRHCGAVRKDEGIGLEETPEAHIARLVEVFREVRRVLRADGVLWLNYGDAYAGSWGAQGHRETPATISRNQINNHPKRASHTGTIRSEGVKPKDLLMMPARVALALQADGWWIRSQIPWLKRSAMPESANDRPATAVEYLFMLTKSGKTLFWQHRDGGATRIKPAPDYRWINKLTGAERYEPRDGKEWSRVNLWRGRDYFWDGEAVRQRSDWGGQTKKPDGWATHAGGHGSFHKDGREKGERSEVNGGGRNFRNSDLFYESLKPPHGLICGPDGEPLALDVNLAGFAEAHFATFPPKLVEPLIKAATSEKGCCAECGAPWVREVERIVSNRSQNGRGENSDRNDGGKACNADRETKTLGWSPSCDCRWNMWDNDKSSHPPVPCLILDPFGGAGTTGLVADRLGRDAVLIELNAEYAAMARKRIDTDAATRGQGPAPVMRGDDLPLFAEDTP